MRLLGIRLQQPHMVDVSNTDAIEATAYAVWLCFVVFLMDVPEELGLCLHSAN